MLGIMKSRVRYENCITCQEESGKKEGILLEKRLEKNCWLNLGAVWLSPCELEYGRQSYISDSEGGQGGTQKGIGLSHCASKEKEKMGAERPQEKITSFIYQSIVQWMNIKKAIWKFLHPKSYLCIKTIPNGSKKLSIIVKKKKSSFSVKRESFLSSSLVLNASVFLLKWLNMK